MSKEEINTLVEDRHRLGLYSVIELAKMFSVGRSAIDYLLNTGQLKFISPNNKSRFILLKDYLACIGVSKEDIEKNYDKYLLKFNKKEAIAQNCDKDNGSNC